MRETEGKDGWRERGEGEGCRAVEEGGGNKVRRREQKDCGEKER